MSATSLEDALKAQPTDKIVLALLQELAARVENLEKSSKTAEEPAIPVSGLGKQISSDNQDLSEIAEIASSSQPTSNEDASKSCCSYCNLPASSCSCIFVKYGYILDGEDVTEDFTEIDERYAKIKPATLGDSLKECQIAGIPADFRIPLRNFWPPKAWDTPESAMEACGDLIANGGVFLVADYDLRGGPLASYFYGSPGDEERPTLYNILEDLWGVRQSVSPSFRFNQHFGELMPWKRLIVLEGLSATTQTARKFFENFFTTPSSLNKWPSNAITTHLEAKPSHQLFQTDIYLRLQQFHLTWHEIRKVRGDDDDEEIEPRPTNRPSTWGTGDLYATPDMKLFQYAYTISAVYSSLNDDCWTIFLLRPSDFTGGTLGPDAPDFREAAGHFGTYSFQAILVELIHAPMRAALKGWETIPPQIDKLLGTGEDIFCPEEHDRLMLDDDQVTRSRKYFWVINFLQDSENHIRLNIETWNRFRDTVLSLRKGKVPDAELAKGIQYCDDIVKELEGLQTLFKTLQAKTVVLRDGLFSGGSFMESRAATRLGENVMLLTYFTIFYLPLSFCTSVWSTASTFGFHNLAYTMVAIGLSTYIVVFNVNHVINVWKQHYRDLKFTTVTRMRADRWKFWKKTGKAFDRYEPRSGAPAPSEWWIIMYQMRRVVGLMIPTQKDNSQSAKHSKKGKHSASENQMV